MAENKTDATLEEKEKKEPKDVHELYGLKERTGLLNVKVVKK